jgi:hypothetical protein
MGRWRSSEEWGGGGPVGNAGQSIFWRVTSDRWFSEVQQRIRPYVAVGGYPRQMHVFCFLFPCSNTQHSDIFCEWTLPELYECLNAKVHDYDSLIMYISSTYPSCCFRVILVLRQRQSWAPDVGNTGQRSFFTCHFLGGYSYVECSWYCIFKDYTFILNAQLHKIWTLYEKK